MIGPSLVGKPRLPPVLRQSWFYGVLVLFLYLLFPNRNYFFDAVDYAYSARTGIGLFHPHHLIYNAMGHLLYRVFLPLSGPAGPDALLILRLVNSLVTAAMVGLLHAVLCRLTRPDLAALGALLFAFSYGIWYMATSVEVYPMTLFLEVLALFLFLRARAVSVPLCIELGALTGIGMLFHQTGIFFVPVMALLMWRRLHSQRAMLFYSTTAGFVAGVPYLLVGWMQGARTMQAYKSWILSYVYSEQYRAGVWGGGLSPGRLAMAPLGFFASLFYPEFVARFESSGQFFISPREKLALVPVLGFGAVLAALLFIIAARTPAAPMGPEERQLRPALWLWVALFGGFTCYWEPSNQEFWLLILPPLGVLITLALRQVDAGPGRAFRRTLLVALVPCLFLGNLGTRIYADSRPGSSVTLGILDRLKAAGLTSDDFVLGNISEISPYAKYFWGRELPLHSLAHVNWQGPGLPGDKGAAMAGFRQRIDEALSRGPVYLLEPEADPTAAQLFASPQWTAEDYHRFYAGDLATAQVLGTFNTYDKQWKIYRLHPRGH